MTSLLALAGAAAAQGARRARTGSTPVEYAVANITSVNYFAAAAGGPDFTAGLGAIAVVFRKISAGNLVREWRFTRHVSNVSGYRAMIYDGSNARVQLNCVSAVPANVSEVNTIAALGQNTLHRLVATAHAGALANYMDGSLLSAATALPSYTPATVPFSIVTSGATDEIEIVSVSAIDGAGMDAAAVSAWDAQVTADGSRAVAGATHHWEAEDWAGSGSWTDRIAGLALALAAAAPTKRNIAGASWA
jgi:hypothetical protein